MNDQTKNNEKILRNFFQLLENCQNNEPAILNNDIGTTNIDIQTDFTRPPQIFPEMWPNHSDFTSQNNIEDADFEDLK